MVFVRVNFALSQAARSLSDIINMPSSVQVSCRYAFSLSSVLYLGPNNQTIRLIDALHWSSFYKRKSFVILPLLLKAAAFTRMSQQNSSEECGDLRLCLELTRPLRMQQTCDAVPEWTSSAAVHVLSSLDNVTTEILRSDLTSST